MTVGLDTEDIALRVVLRVMWLHLNLNISYDDRPATKRIRLLKSSMVELLYLALRELDAHLSNSRPEYWLPLYHNAL